MFDQSEFEIRFEWGAHGLGLLAPISDAVIIVDIMSFSTAVTMATARGALVFPYRWKDESRVIFAQSMGAELAGPRNAGGYSLSPLSLMALQPGNRIVLPSPNGATLSLATGTIPTFAGCLRNARAVAQAAQTIGPRIAVIACGERWSSDETLRPAFEDQLGAGAIISFLVGTLSPEAEAAAAIFANCRSDVLSRLRACASGKELIERGFEADIPVIAALNEDMVAPRLQNSAFFSTSASAGADPLLHGKALEPPVEAIQPVPEKGKE